MARVCVTCLDLPVLTVSQNFLFLWGLEHVGAVFA